MGACSFDDVMVCVGALGARRQLCSALPVCLAALKVAANLEAAEK